MTAGKNTPKEDMFAQEMPDRQRPGKNMTVAYIHCGSGVFAVDRPVPVNNFGLADSRTRGLADSRLADSRTRGLADSRTRGLADSRPEVCLLLENPSFAFRAAYAGPAVPRALALCKPAARKRPLPAASLNSTSRRRLRRSLRLASPAITQRSGMFICLQS